MRENQMGFAPQQLVQWAENPETVQQPYGAVPIQQIQVPVVSFISQQVQEYQKLGVQYTELIGSYVEMKEDYQAALQKISNLELGMRSTDYELLEDNSAARLYLAKGSSREIFAEISINAVQMMWLLNPNGEDFYGFSIYGNWHNGNSFCIDVCEKTLDTPRLLIQAFEKAGVAIMVSRSMTAKHALLRRLLLKKIGNNFVIVPYLSGWADGNFRYVTLEGAAKLHSLGAKAPSLKRHFANLQMLPQDIHEIIASSVVCFGENLALLLFSVAVGAILYTPLSQAAGLRPDCLFAIDNRKKSAKEARKHLQIWETEIRISLSQGKYLEEKLCESKDEILFVVDEGSAYSLKTREKFLTILCSREVQNPANESIIELQTVPVLLSSCISEWGDFYERTLSLPLPDGIPMREINRNKMSSFYREFVNWLNVNTRWLPEKISALEITRFQSLDYGDTYRWVMAAHKILTAYLQVIGITSPVSLRYFDEFVQDWLRQSEHMHDLSLGERFVQILLEFKVRGALHFAKIEQYEGTEETWLNVYYDEVFVYLSAEVFKKIVENFLSGYSYIEVYRELIDMEYAKGERGHAFPKVSLKHANGNQRIRMAKLQRQLLLSEEEILLEV